MAKIVLQYVRFNVRLLYKLLVRSCGLVEAQHFVDRIEVVSTRRSIVLNDGVLRKHLFEGVAEHSVVAFE